MKSVVKISFSFALPGWSLEATIGACFHCSLGGSLRTVRTLITPSAGATIISLASVSRPSHNASFQGMSDFFPSRMPMTFA